MKDEGRFEGSLPPHRSQRRIKCSPLDCEKGVRNMKTNFSVTDSDVEEEFQAILAKDFESTALYAMI